MTRTCARPSKSSCPLNLDPADQVSVDEAAATLALTCHYARDPQREWAIGADPAYVLDRRRLAELGNEDLVRGNLIADQHLDRFTWTWYGSKDHRTDLRRQALARFLTDLVVHPGRYVGCALPQLPFYDDAFDLAVCSHLLFTWADQLGRGWHAAALLDLARVAGEVRVFRRSCKVPVILCRSGTT